MTHVAVDAMGEDAPAAIVDAARHLSKFHL
jgi:hypothetical protein